MAGQSLFGFQSSQADYWLPAKPASAEPRSAVCERCAAELLVESRFCHRCGRPRQSHSPESGVRQSLRDQIAAGLTFGLGMACVLAAVFTVWLQHQGAPSEWPAFHAYRIEWLLGSAVAFLAGIFLNKGFASK